MGQWLWKKINAVKTAEAGCLCEIPTSQAFSVLNCYTRWQCMSSLVISTSVISTN